MTRPHSDIKMFMRLEPDVPHLTHQSGIKTRSVNGHGQLYKTPELRNLEAKFISLLEPYAPPIPWNCPIGLTIRWIFLKPKRAKGIFKTTKPDCTNLIKTLEDCMTRCGFWKDDALVVHKEETKLWAGEKASHGIYILIRDFSIFNHE
ncbi:MAG: RusA family crossover junction endodeoxyribonuclease [Kiritimatiellia bacterium]